MVHGFKKGGKFHPTSGKSSIAVSSDQVNLKSPTSSIVQQIKKQNIDSQGNFSHVNKKLGNKREKIKLEEVKIFNPKTHTFLLKGTSPTNDKTITKIVKLN